MTLSRAALAGMIALLLWALFSSVAILFGAALAVQLGTPEWIAIALLVAVLLSARTTDARATAKVLITR